MCNDLCATIYDLGATIYVQRFMCDDLRNLRKTIYTFHNLHKTIYTFHNFRMMIYVQRYK